jgi:hypothetical protein
MKFRSLHVIASAAKQSRVVGGTLDCFVALLLAMTPFLVPAANDETYAFCSANAFCTAGRSDMRLM